MNMGNKNLFKLNKRQEKLLSEPWMKYTLVFAIFFMSTKNIFLALGFSFLLYLVVNHFLNDESPYCIIPNKFQEIADSLDTNGDGKVSFNELLNAPSVLSNKNKNENKEGMGLKATQSKNKHSQNPQVGLIHQNNLDKDIKEPMMVQNITTVSEHDDSVFVSYPELLYPIVINGRGIF
jgi:hypothetical protein